MTIEDIIAANGERVPSADESGKVFPLALVVLTDHKLSDEEWEFYERAMDFLEADANQRLVDHFPEELYPGQQEFWRFLVSESDPPYLNFSATTSGHGTMRFEVGRRKQNGQR